MKDAMPPDGTHLPVEPARPIPQAALKEAAQGRAGNLSPYQMSMSDFDVAFITPVVAYGPQLRRSRRRNAIAAAALARRSRSRRSWARSEPQQLAEHAADFRPCCWSA